MDSTLVSNLGTQTEKLSTGESIVLLEARLKQQLKPWQVENGKAQFSNYLYQLFDRDNAELPLKSTYTGLWQQLQKLCEVDPELPELIKLTFILKLNDNEIERERETIQQEIDSGIIPDPKAKQDDDGGF